MLHYSITVVFMFIYILWLIYANSFSKIFYCIFCFNWKTGQSKGYGVQLQAWMIFIFFVYFYFLHFPLLFIFKAINIINFLFLFVRIFILQIVSFFNLSYFISLKKNLSYFFFLSSYNNVYFLFFIGERIYVIFFITFHFYYEIFMLFHNYICFFLSLSTQLNRKKEVFFLAIFLPIFYSTKQLKKLSLLLNFFLSQGHVGYIQWMKSLPYAWFTTPLLSIFQIISYHKQDIR